MAFLGIDVGTTACKASAFRRDGGFLHTASGAYPILSPHPGWAELDPHALWETVSHCVREAAARCGEPIEAVSFSSQGEGILPLDEKGAPLYNIIASLDQRATGETRELKGALGEDFFFRTGGQILSTAGSAPKILWMERNLERRPARYVCVSDYVMLRLGFGPATDHSMAARTLLYDRHTGDWSVEALRALGVAKEAMPVIRRSGDALGTIAPELCRELGLGPGCQVVVGGHDQPCALLGTGADSDEEAAYSLGTTETLICRMKDFTPALQAYGLCCYPHVRGSGFVTLPGNFTGGNLLQWFRDQFGGEELRLAAEQGGSAYELLTGQMGEEPTGLLVLPHFTTTGSPYNDDSSCGVIAGLRFSTTRGEVIRGLLEGVTYETLLNLTLLREAGVAVRTLRAVGGVTRSPRVMQLKADVLGTPIRVPRVENASGKGAAMLAAWGSGAAPDPESTWRDNAERAYLPDAAKHKRYLEIFEQYRRLYPAIKTVRLADGQ